MNYYVFQKVVQLSIVQQYTCDGKQNEMDSFKYVS